MTLFELAGYALVAIFVLTGFCMWLFPVYGVWSARKHGDAEYAFAINEQNVQILEAESRLKAAKKNKEAAIIEAEAVSEQIKRIGADLQKHDLYLKWQWIEMMRERNTESDTIYVATEAGLPVLEATRR